MSYATMMVPLALGVSNAEPLKVAADIAARFGAGILGVTACERLSLTYGGAYLSGEVFERIQDQTEKLAREAEAEFRALLSPHVKQLEWRCAETYEPLYDYFARQARSADLIVSAG